MGYSFPDVEAILQDRLSAFGDAYLYLVVGFEDRVANGDAPAAVHVYKVGGQESGVERQDRIEVAVYGPGRDAARDVAEAIKDDLTSGPIYAGPGVGTLDRTTVEVVPHGVPYPSDRVSLWTATYRVDTRPV